jgi:hypothetical protein
VVGLYQIDFTKAVALFLSNTEPILAEPNPHFTTPLRFQEYRSGQNSVVAFYVYSTHMDSGPTHKIMEAKPEDCVGYCVLNLDDVFKSVFAGKEESRKMVTVELVYSLRHPDAASDATLSRTQSKLFVSVCFRCLRDEPLTKLGGSDAASTLLLTAGKGAMGESAAVLQMPMSMVACKFVRAVTAKNISDALLAQGPRLSFR